MSLRGIYACIECVVLHDPNRIEICLSAPLAALYGILPYALKTVSQVRSGQAGNIARAEVQLGAFGLADGVLRLFLI